MPVTTSLKITSLLFVFKVSVFMQMELFIIIYFFSMDYTQSKSELSVSANTN